LLFHVTQQNGGCSWSVSSALPNVHEGIGEAKVMSRLGNHSAYALVGHALAKGHWLAFNADADIAQSIEF